MKVVIVNASDSYGGAARAAYRLHRALLSEGVDSQMLVQSKTTDDFTVLGPTKKVQIAIAMFRPSLDELRVYPYKHRSSTLFSPAWLPFSAIVEHINAIAPDVVHLHWINKGMMRVEDIARIRAPIVWSLHDNWAFTGGCHIMWECGKYTEFCGACPNLGSSKTKDLSYKVFSRKKKSFSKIENMVVVGLSNWLAKCARESVLFSNRSVVCLPNPIDVEKYAPLDKKAARILLGLPCDRKILLFGAMDATGDVNKGFNELIQALQRIQTSNVELVVFGASQPEKTDQFSQKTHYLGLLHDDVTLRVLYNAADVMLVPSLQENLSNSIMESLACGTPVVSFDVGGNADLVDHQVNGYLAEPLDIKDFARGIDWVLEESDYESLSSHARRKIIQNFDSRVVAPKYIGLYRSVLKSL